MGPVRQNPIQRTVSLFICVCIALCTIVAHNIAQNRPDSFPSYPPDDHHSSDGVYLREGGSTCKTTLRLKLGTYYSCPRAVSTGRVHNDARVNEPWTRAASFCTPVFMARGHR